MISKLLDKWNRNCRSLVKKVLILQKAVPSKKGVRLSNVIVSMEISHFERENKYQRCLVSSIQLHRGGSEQQGKARIKT